MDDQSERGSHHPFRAGRAKSRYDRDLYSWAIEQAALLRAGGVSEADTRNIAEEIDDVGSEQYEKLESALRIILLHLLKWDNQSSRCSRSWWARITVQRNHVRRVLRKNPGLKSQLERAVAAAYQDARIQAAAQTRLNPRSFPVRCPYSWNGIMERQISWPRKN